MIGTSISSPKKKLLVCFFNLSKAFDTLPHWNILSNLKRVGVSGSLLKWFNSYLSCRQQRVVLGGSSSSPIEAVSGVPQGSILGPLLFSLCMDPLTAVPLTANSRLILYADDILYCTHQSQITKIFVIFSLILIQSVTGFHLLVFS